MKKKEYAWGASDRHSVPCFRPSLMYSLRATFSIGIRRYTVVFFISMPGMRSILWSHSWCLGSHCASSSEKTLPY